LQKIENVNKELRVNGDLDKELKKRKLKELTYLFWLMTYLKSLSTMYLYLKASKA